MISTLALPLTWTLTLNLGSCIKLIPSSIRLSSRSKADDALLLFEQGFSCSEAVFSVLTQDFRLNSDTALRILKGFGAGVACIDDICGALSGTIMVIGLRYGRIKADDKAAKEKTYAVVGEVLRRFMQ